MTWQHNVHFIWLLWEQLSFKRTKKNIYKIGVFFLTVYTIYLFFLNSSWYLTLLIKKILLNLKHILKSDFFATSASNLRRWTTDAVLVLKFYQYLWYFHLLNLLNTLISTAECWQATFTEFVRMNLLTWEVTCHTALLSMVKTSW